MIESPASEITSDDEYERVVQNVMDMGYERSQVENWVFSIHFIINYKPFLFLF